MATLLQTKGEELTARRKELADLFAQYPDLDVPEAKAKEFASEVKRRNDELTVLGTAFDELREQDRIAQENKAALDELQKPQRTVPHAGGGSDVARPERKGLGDLFIESKAFKEYQSGNHRGPIVEVPIETKTLFSEGAGFAPQAIRTGQVVDSPQQQPKLVDVVPSTTTTMVAVVYMRETTFTNAAAETAEGGTYPEAALAYTEETSSVRKIAVFLPVTDEQLADVSGMQDRLNNRLLLMLRQRLDSQMVAGDGNAPNLLGILNTPNILTQATGADPNVDAIFKAIVQVQSVGFSEPNAVLLHPLNWQAMRLLKTSTGIYLFGYPGEPGMARLWGLPVVTSTYVTQNTGIVGDFNGYTELAFKAGIEFEVSNSHNDYFAKGQLAIRAQFRVAWVITRPSALCTVTSLP